jgi:hypothetical protein
MSAKYSVHPSRLALAITASLAAGQLGAATITVDTLADPGGSTECSLRSAISAVTGQIAVDGCLAGDGLNDAIEFAPGLTGTITLASGSLVVDSNVTITGPGAADLTIDANRASRVLQVQGYSTVSISGVTVQGGYDSFGAGIYITDGYLSLQDCVIQDNQASGFGGGIELFGGSLDVNACTFENNAAGQHGGGLAVTRGNAYVSGSVFENNSAYLGGGAQVYYQQSSYVPGPQGERGSSGAYLQILDSTITGNNASIGGGLAAGGGTNGGGKQVQGEPPLPGGPPNLVVLDSTISGNQAYLGGGIGAYLPPNYGGPQRGYPTLINSVSVDGSLVSQNNAYSGGGIGAYGGSLSLRESVVAENQAVVGGGGIAIYGLGPGGPGPNASGKRWDGSAAPSGALSPDSMIVEYSLIEANLAPSGGGVIARGQGSVFLASQISGNLGGGVEVVDAPSYLFASQLIDNSSADVGGLDCRNLSICQVRYSSVTGNSGYITGGIRSGTGTPLASPQGLLGSLSIESSTISGNQGSIVGGLYAANVTVRHSTVAQNQQLAQAPRGGETGGVIVGDGSIIDHSLIAGNLAGATPSDIRNLGANPIQTDYSLIGTGAGFSYTGTGNLFDVDPLLGPLDANGSAYSLTHALLTGSPAIDAGNPAIVSPPDYDQRGPGFDRIVGAAIDIGAFEVAGGIVAPEVGLSTSAIDFSGLLVGLNDVATLTITSTGTGNLDLGPLSIAAARGGVFQLINDTCSNQSLAPTATCTVDVNFQPPAPGTFDADLSIPSNAPSSPDVVAISGLGLAPVMSLNPTSVDLGMVSIGELATGSTQVTNTGNAPLTFTGTSAIAAPFALVAGPGLCLDGGPTVLGPSESCTLTFSFSSTEPGTSGALVDLFSDSLGGDSQVDLTAIAIAGAVAPPVPVPFMGRVGSLILAGSLMVLGLFGLRRVLGS